MRDRGRCLVCCDAGYVRHSLTYSSGGAILEPMVDLIGDEFGA